MLEYAIANIFNSGFFMLVFNTADAVDSPLFKLGLFNCNCKRLIMSETYILYILTNIIDSLAYTHVVCGKVWVERIIPVLILSFTSTNQIICLHASLSHFVFFHFVHISMGQIVNNFIFFFTENQHFFFSQKI